MSPLSCCYVYG